MKIFTSIAAILVIGLGSCSTIQRSYFTVDTRHRIEERALPVNKLQFYVDKDVELRRELASREAKVSSGKVIFENGKYVNIILLKAGTLGVCTQMHDNSLEIAFENGENKNLRFGVADKASSGTIYSLFADQWINNTNTYAINTAPVGKIVYDGEMYYMRFGGARPRLMIEKSATDKYKVNKRVMSGRKID